jgi:chemotaxis protein CheD
MENVRMGELAVSSREGDELIAIGLGSCIGLALIDPQAGVAGLAHVVLPHAQGSDGPPSKFGDQVVTEMISHLERAGAVRRRLIAIMIGGARMFSLGASLDIGARNVASVRDALKAARIRIHAEETGGSRGRTARVVLGHGVSSQLAGGERTSLLDLRTSTAIRSPAGCAGFAGASS